MPKPKSGDIYKREFRITPADGLPIAEWHVNDDDFKVLLACEEGGGDTGKRLHYHCYIETTRSESWLKKWVYKIAHCYNGESGNTVYFSRQPHDNTIGYVVKSGNVTVRHGCTQTFIDEWIAKSDEYKRSKESKRKREQRSRIAVIKQIEEEVAKGLHGGLVTTTVEGISEALLRCYAAQCIYPSRMQHELLVIKLIHPYNDHFVRSYYNKTFSFI